MKAKYKTSIIVPLAFLTGLSFSGCSTSSKGDLDENISRHIERTNYSLETGPSRVYVINLRRVIQNYTGSMDVDVKDDIDNRTLGFPNLEARTLNEVFMNVDTDSDHVITESEISSALKRYKKSKTKAHII
jgi:hypothetical protein